MKHDSFANIGDSLLSSSNLYILNPIDCVFGKLVVRPLPEKNTYFLILNNIKGTFVIAGHPNGFSCYELAERMISGNIVRIKEQAEYIVRCGGTALSIEQIQKIMET